MQFSTEDMTCVVSTTDGEKRVGAAHASGWDIVTVGGTLAVTGDTVAIGRLTYSVYKCGSLGSSLVFNAGDAAYVTAIYGL